MDRLEIDLDYMRNVMLELLRTPSPSGRTDAVMQIIGDHLAELGLPMQVTRRGVLRATLRGETSDTARAVAVHADTIGCMVKRVKENGRIEVVPVGTHSARFAEGAHVTVFVDDLTQIYTGTVLPLMSSGHNFGEAVDTQGVGWHQVEIRIDEDVASAADVHDLGIRVGDFVALDAAPQITPNGYIKSRHLDDKAGLAACLAAVKALVDHDAVLPVDAYLLVTIGEEVGMGATHGLDDRVAELVAVDNAVVSEGQQSREDTVNIGMLDSTGPFDYHLTRRLIGLCEEHQLPYRRDVYRFYRSDAAPAIESGMEARTALVGFGVDSSHGHERTHLDGVQRIAELLTIYLTSPLTFSDWDEDPTGKLEDFPSHSVQPAEPEPETAPGRHG
ncbi:osmoprotectant NAGGN system M42 family peptidase [Phytoactinopolyspora halotolerans]|uniref:Osmoprotectant NAGGN system M42 family peptidase n=1 Tax=Phytoactinopolyspora halotolerans TaxID=1981512 RepID=A0A6L9SB13_9ACTN|nr:osmoprotectant NAGGN system M42 family peptidase [Phytoactinopolyspora halotolerans]NEE01804.1 osmoprotectant NAGGN system M42 family peptidase [Phytoactinopolyspora halotolerans]